MAPPPVLPPPPGLEWCVALLAYQGVGRELVARLKYRNARSVLPWLAAGMADLVRAVEPDLSSGPGVVTWVPTSAARRRARGFDQGRLLAVAVAARLGLPCRSLLRRLPGPAQTGANRPDRLAGPRLVPSTCLQVPVLLVDDVVTTGATLGAAARALAGVGATSVMAVTAARTAHRG